MAVDSPPYVEEERPPIFRPPPAPAPVESRGVLTTTSQRVAVVAGAAVIGGFLGFVLPYLLHK